MSDNDCYSVVDDGVEHLIFSIQMVMDMDQQHG